MANDQYNAEAESADSSAAATVSLEARGTEPNVSDSIIGKTLDNRFRIEKDLTEGGADAGGIGVVYLAQDTKLLGKRVVVKILQKAVIKNEDILRKFQHEKEALIRLDHPNIVRILDSGTLSDGNPFMVMEYIPGRSLRRVLSEKKQLSFEFCAHVIESVADALGAAHAERVLHRDIKPENIMLTPQADGMDRVRLIDFGIARVENAQLAPVTEVERGIGTVKYMSPEQLLGRLDQTPATDVYSCAIVAYELLMGEQPFKPVSVADMFEQQRSTDSFLPAQFRAEIPAEAKKIILQALAFNPSERPQDIRKFGKDLASALRFSQRETKAAKYDNFGESQADPMAMTEPLGTAAQNELSILTKPKTEDLKIPDQPTKSKLPVYLGAGLLILAIGGGLLGLAAWKLFPAPSASENQNANAANANFVQPAEPPKRELAYYLMVQKMRDGKPYEKPFRSTGQVAFEKGYEFQMFFQGDSDGFVYLLNEDEDEQGNPIFNLLYPTPKNNNNSMPIPPGRQISIGGRFANQPGTEVVLLVWTAKKNDILEAAVRSADNTQITNKENVRQVADFLQNYKDQKPEVVDDDANEQMIIKGKGDVVVHRIKLEYR